MSEPDAGSPAPQHDPVAEDMDLMTHQEAAARFYDEIQRLRTEEQELVAAGDRGEAVAELRARIADLQRAADRVSRRSSPL